MFNRSEIPCVEAPEFLEFIRAKGCLTCDKGPRSDPHHVRNRQWREPHRFDFCVIPLCRPCHDRVGAFGIERVLERSGMRASDLALAVAGFLVEFFEHHGQVAEAGSCESRIHTPF